MHLCYVFNKNGAFFKNPENNEMDITFIFYGFRHCVILQCIPKRKLIICFC